MNVELRNHIVRLMEQYGIDQSQLAEQSGYPRSKLNEIINGKKDDINVSSLEKIAHALGHHVALVPDKSPVE